MYSSLEYVVQQTYKKSTWQVQATVKLKVEDIVQHLVARTNQWCGPMLWIHIPSSLIYSLTFGTCNAVQCWTVFLYFNGISLKLNRLIKCGTRESMLVNKTCERACLIRNIWILNRCQFVMRENKNLMSVIMTKWNENLLMDISILWYSFLWTINQ